MEDRECVRFLQWALPRLQMHWSGFRRVRKQVCKRLNQRLEELCLTDLGDYRDYLVSHPQEWTVLAPLTRVTISRFYRDKMLFHFVEQQVIPSLVQKALARNDSLLKILSLGSASGEEPYTMSILWQLKFQQQFPNFDFQVVALETDPLLIQRSKQACYPYSSVKNLPQDWRQTAFYQKGDLYCLKSEYQQGVQFLQQDVRELIPEDRFDVVLCRNLAFTYFDEPLQNRILDSIAGVLGDEGVLIIGIHENLPEDQSVFRIWSEKLGIFQKLPELR